LPIADWQLPITELRNGQDRLIGQLRNEVGLAVQPFRSGMRLAFLAFLCDLAVSFVVINQQSPIGNRQSFWG
jgi:hypothetical protein